MRFVHTIAAILILALVSSSAIASVCATSCAVGEAMAKIMHVSSAISDHCDMASMHGKQSGTGHKNCTMAGCHFAQVSPMNVQAISFVTDYSSPTLPRFNAIAASADLTPPIKPPA